MGREAEERCGSRWPEGVVVRCDRWAGHGGEHRGFDGQDMAYRWSDEQVEDRRLGQEPKVEGGPAWRSVFDQPKTAIQQWKDRCLKAEKARDVHFHSWEHAVAREEDWKRRNCELNETAGQLSERMRLLEGQRDTEARNAMTLVQQLQTMQRERDDARREARAVRDQMSAEDGERLQLIRKLQELEQATREMKPSDGYTEALENQVAIQAEMIRRQREELQNLRVGAEA